MRRSSSSRGSKGDQSLRFWPLQPMAIGRSLIGRLLPATLSKEVPGFVGLAGRCVGDGQIINKLDFGDLSLTRSINPCIQN